MCSVMGVSRSGYYKWARRPESDRSKRRQALAKRVRYHFADNYAIYGSRKITEKLREEGVPAGERTVGRIMRENRLRSCIVRKFRVQTTDSNHELPIAPNQLNQQFHTDAPNKVWVTDITYIRSREGMRTWPASSICTPVRL
jgi:putative transposase